MDPLAVMLSVGTETATYKRLSLSFLCLVANEHQLNVMIADDLGRTEEEQVSNNYLSLSTA